MVSLDRDVKFLSINKAGAEIIRQLGRNPDDLIGVSVWDAFPEVKGTIVEREIKRALENGVQIEYEFLYPPNQHLYQVQVCPSPEGVILVFRDLASWKTTISAATTSRPFLGTAGQSRHSSREIYNLVTHDRRQCVWLSARPDKYRRVPLNQRTSSKDILGSTRQSLDHSLEEVLV